MIFTEGRRKSPFLEELESKHSLSPIEWKDFPAVRGSITRLVVRVGNQEGHGGAPTFAIKDYLHAAGYQWQNIDWPSWVKSFPAEGFNIEVLKSEVWADSADGLEIKILDDTETLAAHYFVEGGRWRCLTDELDTLFVPKT